ncbi:cell wall metabolism sensor histidine kinase WalK [Geitlerinema sp. PCC 7407]|uniref:sensor histidine kinase n=1 Tax=Geitlerinema sp. PCC 7407 TaxID=1173025 RepID=UPI00029FA94D|nr:HAMP domain-containing sensor histidine kinase [Geitlerinema sp. PCC 7407]AFY65123.1 integral membrane sensor signal transduction histidine kinase [Geitlerinema sp. PCC 7407]
MFQATRRRLALWYTTVTAVLLLLFGSGFYLYVRTTLIERIDDTLSHVVEVVQRSLVIEPTGSGTQLQVNVEASFRNNANTLDDDHIDLEWFSPTGELLWSTFAETLTVPMHLNANGETVHLGDDHLLRQVTQRIQFGRQVLGYLRVSHPWFEVTKPTRQLILDLTLGMGLTVASVGGIGWFLSGLAIAPVRESYQRLKQFTADASHEMRNPIAMIQTNVQVALADPDWDPAQRQQLKVVERLTRRLGRLVDDLLFLARQDSGMVQPRWSPVYLDELLMEVVEEQQAIADEKAIALSLDLLEAEPSPDLPNGSADWLDTCFLLQGDRDQLARLMTNLIGNAVQYTPTRGQVQVLLERRSRPSHPATLQIQVKDTGIGIPASALPHIFNRFYRVDPARTHDDRQSGSGLGLAIAQAIVENHHGQIHIDSQTDQGTTVTVALPIDPGPSPKASLPLSVE